MDNKLKVLCLAGVLLSGMAAHAEVIEPSKVPKGVRGGTSPFGETAAETANKKVVFDWNYTNAVERNPQKSFETYVSKDYCNHGHMSTSGQRDCANYQETYDKWVKNYSTQIKPGERIEIPDMAAVNGEMVTMYGAGVDIFQVKNGKVTAHWDASPPAEYTANVPRKADAGIVMDQMHLTGVSIGPMTPYGETIPEMNRKRAVLGWHFMSMVQGKPKEAAEKFLADSYCDHSHQLTNGKKDCATRAELLAGPKGQYKAAKLGDRIDQPYMASVDGEIVTTYSSTVDIWRVVDGKITDHWDATPPSSVTVAAHAPEVVENMMKVLAGEKKMGNAPLGGAIPPEKK
ncbi:MAG: hypothetical protein QM808_09380 [Steroidobacteraceae bacterium]